MALCFALVVVEGLVLERAWAAATGARATLVQMKHEWDWLARQAPALSPENAAAITADVAAAGHVVAELRAALQGTDTSLFAPPPAKPMDAFFALANFVEKLRLRAAQAQVVLKPDERFGFAAHANEGPVAEQVAVVQLQWLAAQYLVEMLLESRPLALLSVRRERPPGVGSRESAEDFFVMDSPLSRPQPGHVETAAFQLEFTGQTAALRNFLNSLASFRVPAVVRNVEVEPLATDPLSQTAATPINARAPVPLVRQNISKFAVTVELILSTNNAESTAL